MVTGLSAMGALPGELRELRLRVRAFLEAEIASGAFQPVPDAWMSGVDLGFQPAARRARLGRYDHPGPLRRARAVGA